MQTVIVQGLIKTLKVDERLAKWDDLWICFCSEAPLPPSLQRAL